MTKNIFKILLLVFVLIEISASTPLKKGSDQNKSTESDNSFVNFNRVSLDVQPFGRIVGGLIDTNSFLSSSGFFLSGYDESGNIWANGVMPKIRMYDYTEGTAENPHDSIMVYHNSKYVMPFGKEWQLWKDAVKLGAEFYDGDNDGVYNPIDKNGNGVWDEDEDRPVLYGDEMTWSVFNDGLPSNNRKLLGVVPLGINIRQTVFGFKENPKLEKVVFIKYTIENSGTVSSMFSDVIFSLAANQDLGSIFGDYIGTFNQGVVTYARRKDWDLNGDQLAVYSTFLQTPIAKDYPGRAYYLEGENLEQKIMYDGQNTGAVSSAIFDRYSMYTSNNLRSIMIGDWNEDPCNGVLGAVFGEDCEQTYPKIIFSGNPILENGWLNIYPNNKSYLLTTFPFYLEVGKPIDIIIAHVVGTADDAISALKDAITSGKKLKYQFYDKPKQFPEVEVSTITDNESMELIWEADFSYMNGYMSELNLEGYEINMFNSPSTNEFVNNQLNKKTIARYDLRNRYKNFLIENENDYSLEMIYKDGNQVDYSGQKILHSITWDPFNNTPLIKGKPYYFSVTPFGIDTRKLREHSIDGTYVVPADVDYGLFKNQPTIINDNKGNVGVVIGENLNDAYYKGILIEHTKGDSDVEIFYSVYDQDAVTDDLYEISFEDFYGETYKMIMYLNNVTKDESLFRKIIMGDMKSNINDMYDGFILDFNWVEPGKITSSFSGDDKWFSDFNNLHTGVFYIGRDIEKTQKIFAVNLKQSNSISIDDLTKVELRFADTSKAFRYVRRAIRYTWWGKDDLDSGFVNIPVSAYAIDKQGNEKKLAIAFLENAFFGDPLGMPDGKWNPGINVAESKEYLVILNSPYTDDVSERIEYTGTSRRIGDIANGFMIFSTEEVSDSIKAIARSPWFNAMYVVGFNTPVYQEDFNPTGTLTIKPSLVLTEEDKYYFKVKKEKTADEKKAQFDKINIYPNPLFGYNSSSNAFGYGNDDPFITFSNLPEEVDIRIYTLSGVLIKSINKSDKSASYRWNLQNESGMRIASGMYIAIIDVPNIGQRIMKFAIIQPQKRVHYK